MTVAKKKLLIIGGGQAGLQLAASARAADGDIEITVLCDEDRLPYQRPPLSKAFLLGRISEAALGLQNERFYQSKRIAVLTGGRVDCIERECRTVHLENEQRLSYDVLALATGSRPKRLPSVDEVTQGIFYLRDLRDALALRLALDQARHALVIGGGFIGLEFAAVARTQGLKVTVVEAGSRLMARGTSEPISNFFETAHVSRGVSIHKGMVVRRLLHVGGKLNGAILSNGQTLDVDLLLVGIGALANDELASNAGLPTAEGVLVDKTLRTIDPNIFAIGDCARVNTDTGSHRMESVQNAIDQARHVALSLHGTLASYAAVPWFWSDQYDFKLQIVGSPSGATQTIFRGNPSDGKFSVYHFRATELLAVESVNQPAAHATSRQLFAKDRKPSPHQVGDSTFDLRSLLLGAPVFDD